MYGPIKTIDAHVHLTSLLYSQDIFHQKENVLDGDCVKACLERMDKHGIDQCLALAAQGLSIPPIENPMLIKMANSPRPLTTGFFRYSFSSAAAA